jgi:hypothetical protein
MDLEEFYAADERRRHSAELEFGRDWNDGNGRWGVSWVEDTGEIYLMREPSVGVWADAFGDMKVRQVPDEALDVEVLGVVTGRSAVESVMSGWEQKMLDADGLAWLRDRVKNAAAHAHDTPAIPSDELPDDKD